MATKGIAVDKRAQEIFVSQTGGANRIDVYRLNDNATPTALLRRISGSSTLLNGPIHMYLDSEKHELFVVNATDEKVLVFDKNADGDTPPLRVINLL